MSTMYRLMEGRYIALCLIFIQYGSYCVDEKEIKKEKISCGVRLTPGRQPYDFFLNFSFYRSLHHHAITTV